MAKPPRGPASAREKVRSKRQIREARFDAQVRQQRMNLPAMMRLMIENVRDDECRGDISSRPAEAEYQARLPSSPDALRPFAQSWVIASERRRS